MFILPEPASANALPPPSTSFDLATVSATSAKWLSWPTPFGLTAQLHLPLTILATLVVLTLLRFAFGVVWSRKVGFIPVALAIPCPEKSEASQKSEKPAPAPVQAPRFRLLASIIPKFNFTLPALPQLPPLAEALPITLNPPPPPVMRGRHVYRGGRGVGFAQSHQQSPAQLGHHVAQPKRPEPVRQMVGVEVPLPAIYESQTPVSMAKMIMSRHTHRRPTFIPAPSSRRSSSPSPLVAPRTRSPSP